MAATKSALDIATEAIRIARSKVHILSLSEDGRSWHETSSYTRGESKHFDPESIKADVAKKRGCDPSELVLSYEKTSGHPPVVTTITTRKQLTAVLERPDIACLRVATAAELKFEKDTIKADADKKPPRELGGLLFQAAGYLDMDSRKKSLDLDRIIAAHEAAKLRKRKRSRTPAGRRARGRSTSNSGE